MSNLERRPEETSGGGLATVSHRPTRTVLAPREVPLGGPRAMVVRRTLPHRELRTVGAWCFVDDYGPASPADPRMVVPPHPHTGLQTVTWLQSGEVLHQDSLGHEQVVEPGALNLMTAGHGITHAETATPTSPPLRGVQLWVALPDADRATAPDFEHHAALPLVSDGGLSATVLLGSLAGAQSPATTFTPIVGADVSVGAGVGGELALNPSWEHAVLALSAGLAVDGDPVPEGALVYLGCGRDRLSFASDGALGTGAHALLLGGEPFGEELLMWWNFVARTHDEVVTARDEWTAAVGGAATRFGQVTAYDGPALPAPALPGTRLRPRGSRP